jgi:Zn-dependent M28 family amino/carboxypeptidase
VRAGRCAFRFPLLRSSVAAAIHPTHMEPSVHQLSRIVAATAAITISAVLAISSANAAVPTDSKALRKAVTVKNILDHERALQAIADANGGTRASGTPGYDASAAYVAGKLRGAGYKVTKQSFTFPFFSENAPAEFERVTPDPRTFTLVEDFSTMEYSASGNVTGLLVPTTDVQIPPEPTPSSSSGCDAADFPAVTTPAPVVALIQRGTCGFGVKAANAEAAGYDAAVIFNEGQEGRTEALPGTLGEPGVTIPVISTSFAAGEELYNQTKAGPVTARVFTSTTSETRTTSNVIADTPRGRSDRTVVVGAHLDSVEEGAGINDNGSGSSSILEIALQLTKHGHKPTNKVRFAFWGAEESGLFGSEHYVSQLSPLQIKDIAVNLNFDMVGSPNYARLVYDGDGSDTPDAGPEGSANVEDVFIDYFDSQGLASGPTAFDGRSDYGPFIAAGIPAGGLFTGAEGTKTADEVGKYGGLATFKGKEVAFDPCYHQGCDSLKQAGTAGYDPELYAAIGASYGPGVLKGNLNTKALDEMSDAAAHATLTFAMTTSTLGGTPQLGASKVRTDSPEFKGSHLQK